MRATFRAIVSAIVRAIIGAILTKYAKKRAPQQGAGLVSIIAWGCVSFGYKRVQYFRNDSAG